MKNNSGFSLVELIVVIAIMAILAGVAVPTYTKYIAKANDATVNSQLDEIKTAAFAACAANGKTVSSIIVTTDDEKKTTVEVNPTSTEIEGEITDLLGSTFTVDFKGTSYADADDSSAGSVKWENNKWTEQ